jgi:aryl-alcohol dehydrogenase-like predicted oxidoreductase
MPTISDTDLDVFPLCLGGNVFGWTADRDQSFAVLDAYRAAGGNFIDSSDSYPPGGDPGESERILGEWVNRQPDRDQIVVATKVAKKQDRRGLSPENIRAACDESLERLGLDHIDLYYAHEDDVDTPLADTLGAFDELIRADKVRHIAASNFAAPRLAEALQVSAEHGLAAYVALQPHYNLVERGEFEGELQDLCAGHRLGVMPYFSLAMGFLTGKYRPGGPEVDSPRSGGASRYLEQGGERVLEALDAVAKAHHAPHAAVALAWLRVQPTVVAPIASARNPEQLQGLLPMAELELSSDELSQLDAASAQPV